VRRAEWCQDLLAKVGDRWFAPIAIVQNWTYCAFYVMAELWGSVVISVLFWGFANAICTVKEAKQFYTFFGLGANVALVFSGQTIRHFSAIRAKARSDLAPVLRARAGCAQRVCTALLAVRPRLVQVDRLLECPYRGVRRCTLCSHHRRRDRARLSRKSTTQKLLAGLQVPKGVDGWGVTLRGIMSIVVAFGLVICGLRYLIEKTTVQSATADLPDGAQLSTTSLPAC
jgi:TLC ATP/ADP transporter